MSNTALAAAARHLAAELVKFADALEKRQVRRRPGWVGPVSDEVNAERDAIYSHCFSLAMHLGKDATARGFAMRHNLTESEISRWLSLQVRGIAPGSVVDVNIRRALMEDTLAYEAELAKRLGANRIPNSFPRFPGRIPAYERKRVRRRAGGSGKGMSGALQATGRPD